MRRVTATAPARVDLAGGTLDLWPLYLLHEGAQTVNYAIDRRARATVTACGSGFEFCSRDLSIERRFTDAREARRHPASHLAAEAATALGFEEGVRVELESSVPFGSGLGGSSALLVALVGALARLAGRELQTEETVVLCRDLETRVLQAPAGTQDYEPALRGGLNVITYRPGGGSVSTRLIDRDAFERHVLLFDSGKSHASGANNWEIYQRRLGGDRGVTASLDAIRDAARDMARAVSSWSFEEMGLALAREWTARKSLFPEISTPLIDEAEQRVRAAGAWGLKACGAGGGGVLVILAPADRRAAVAEALARMPAGTLIAAAPENRGLSVD